MPLHTRPLGGAFAITRKLIARRSIALGFLIGAMGCGTKDSPPPQAVKPAPPAQTNPAPAKKTKAASPAPATQTPKTETPLPSFPSMPPAGAASVPGRQNLGELLNQLNDSDLNFRIAAPPPMIDDERAAAHGIRKLVGKHVMLYTDLPSQPEVDELPQVFDLAVPQWRDYFQIDPKKIADWKVWGYVMQDKEKFIAAGLYPDDLPEFPNGYMRGHEFWLYEQPSAYYRRHLTLHEGTHAVMFHWLGGAGPPWYMEGMAELLGTHRWHNGELQLGYSPRSKEEVPEWGRVRILKNAYKAGRALPLQEVLKLPPDAHRNNDAYAWSWAACAFFDQHPKYQEAFRKLRQNTQDVSQEFTTRLFENFRDDIQTMQTEWQLFIANCEYGYDVARNALVVKPAEPLPPGGAKVEIAVDHGWQSTGLVLEAGRTYKLTASGRYSLGKVPQEWWCEPGGVTIRYYHSRPLGMLLAAVRNDSAPASPSELLDPTPIGLGADLTPETTGTLWLKINEHDAEWADNEGKLEVEVKEA
jgi:hypothetical protein